MTLVAPAVKEQARYSDDGFSILEMAVVVSVVAVLVMAAGPTFLGMLATAHRSAAIQHLTNSVVVARGYSVSHDNSYSGVSMAGLEPSITYNASPPGVSADATAAAGQGGVSYAVAASPGYSTVFSSFDPGSSKCVMVIDLMPGSDLAGPGSPYVDSGSYWATADAPDSTCKAAIPADDSDMISAGYAKSPPIH